MTPARDPARHVRPQDQGPAVWLGALAWLGLAALLLALPFVVILTGEPPAGQGVLRDFALGLGFATLSLAGMQFALTGRIKPLLHPFGADAVLLFHRYLSWGLVALMLGHFGILYIWYQDDLGVLNPLRAEPHMTAGRVALGCFATLVASSEFRKRLRLDYLWWRRLHVLLALTGFAAAIWHVLGAGHFTAQDGTRALWLAVTLAWLGLMLWTRLLRPLQQLRNPWRVTHNKDEGDGVHTLILTPQGRGLTGWRPGQFAWLSVGGSPFALREHPFTISTAPEKGHDLSFSIKPLGDDSARLSRTKPGAVAYVDGPYGGFSIDREAEAQGFVMIAGGIGITPFMANLRAMEERRDPRPVILLYANAEWDEIPFRAELARLATRLDLSVVYVIEDMPDKDTPLADCQVRHGRIDAALLEQELPADSRDWPHLMCGPAPMLAATRRALLRMGVPRRHIDSEIFELV